MTIADVIGSVDVFSAAVALGIGAGVTIVATTALARTPRKKMEFEFRLADMKQKNDHEQALKNIEVQREAKLGQIAANKQIEVARIENHMMDLKSNRPGVDALREDG